MSVGAAGEPSIRTVPLTPVSTWSGFGVAPAATPTRDTDPAPEAPTSTVRLSLCPAEALATSEPPEVKAAKMPAIPVGGLESSVPIVEPINPTIAEEALPVVPMARPATALGPSDT